MTVGEAYKGISLDYISEKAETNDYYTTAEKFLTDVWDKPVENLSRKQILWLDGLEQDCKDNQ